MITKRYLGDAFHVAIAMPNVSTEPLNNISWDLIDA